MKKVESDISMAKKPIENYNVMLNSAVKRALETTNLQSKNAAMKTAQTTKEAMDKVSAELEYLQS